MKRRGSLVLSTVRRIGDLFRRLSKGISHRYTMRTNLIGRQLVAMSQTNLEIDQSSLSKAARLRLEMGVRRSWMRMKLKTFGK